MSPLATAFAWGLGTWLGAAASAQPMPGDLTFVEAVFDDQGGVNGLDGATDVAFSPDSRHVYVVGSRDYAVAVFERDATTGELFFVQAVFDGEAGVDGLRNPQNLVVSPDGAHVYVASRLDDAVAVFVRNQETGELSFLEVHFDGIDGVDGLSGITNIAVSADGLNLYATGQFDDAVATFARDPASGALTFIEAIFNGIDVVGGLDKAVALSVSGDGANVYVGGQDGPIVVFSRNLSSGILTFLEVVSGSESGPERLHYISDLALSEDGLNLYVGGLFFAESDGFSLYGFVVFSRDGTTGALTLVETVEASGFPRGIVLSPDGSTLYATTQGAIFEKNNLGDGEASNRSILKPSGENDIVALSRDPETGRLTLFQTEDNGLSTARDPYLSAYRLGVSPDGMHLYATGPDNGAVAIFSLDAKTGAFTHLENVIDGDGGFRGLNGPEQMVLSPGGEHLYVASPSDGLAVLARDSESGSLSFIEAHLNGSFSYVETIDIAISPNGALVYALQVEYTQYLFLQTFVRDPKTGRLTLMSKESSGAKRIVVSPDGVSVYTPEEAWAISPDGAFVYAVKGGDDSVSVSVRDTVTGELELLEDFAGTGDGVEGLDGPTGLALSPDGTHLYVVSRNDSSIVALARDSVTGSLTFLQAKFNGIDGVTGVASARNVVVSPNGRFVYVTNGAQRRNGNPVDDALAVFSRNPTTGAVDFLGAQFDGIEGVNGLAEAQDVVVSPDSRHVYVASFGDNAIAHFTQEPLPLQLEGDGEGVVEGEGEGFSEADGEAEGQRRILVCAASTEFRTSSPMGVFGDLLVLGLAVSLLCSFKRPRHDGTRSLFLK